MKIEKNKIWKYTKMLFPIYKREIEIEKWVLQIYYKV